MEVNSLSAYTSSNLEGLTVRGVEIRIEKVENGYIFRLSGSKESPVKQKNNTYFDTWENFQSTFVYQDLQIGLNEVQSFFERIQKELDNKVKKQLERNKKIKKTKGGA